MNIAFKRAATAISALAFTTSSFAQEPAPSTPAEPQAQTQFLGIPTKIGSYMASACTKDNHTAMVKFDVLTDLGVLAGMDDPDKFKRGFEALTSAVMPGHYSNAMRNFTKDDMHGEKSSEAIQATLEAIGKATEFAARGKSDQLMIGLHGGSVSAEANCKGSFFYACYPDMAKQIAPGQFLAACIRKGQEYHA